mmetsp:Transcript_30342/g.80402  ORF Transcript_30342/g.80402 Transcript_30342/m.80402 type:complete len:89 (+) Transcript_30342:202-468(+)
MQPDDEDGIIDAGLREAVRQADTVTDSERRVMMPKMPPNLIQGIGHGTRSMPLYCQGHTLAIRDSVTTNGCCTHGISPSRHTLMELAL